MGDNLDSKSLLRFKDVYDNLYSLIFSSLYSKINSFDEAEDLTQELFVRLYNKFNEVNDPKAWLYGAMRIILLDYFKDKGRKEVDIEGILVDERMSVANEFREARIVIEEILSDSTAWISDTDRTIFELVAIHEYSFAEVSRHIGLSYRQVRYAFQTTARRLIDLLQMRGISKLEDLL
ncbi:MAG TPA: sigma-70 family RNA polymerase sigma factor [Spirochaetota bacterium]|nr:sigma-70 family RNA polymerase sigma factor [Spirochaetota bacterium]